MVLQQWNSRFLETAHFQREISHHMLEIGVLPFYLVNFVARSISDGKTVTAVQTSNISFSGELDWAIEALIASSPMAGPHNHRYEVSTEQVSVKAGTYDCLNIVMYEDNKMVSTTWVSDKVKAPQVKMISEMSSDFGSDKMTMELISLSP